MDFKIENYMDRINIHKLSNGFDRISRLNGTLVFLFFLINLVVTMQYSFVYNELLEGISITDESIILVPMLGTFTACFLCMVHNYSTNIKNFTDMFGTLIAVLCIILMFSLIPIIGFKFDVLGISVDYWNFTSGIIKFILLYLAVFGLINFIIKAKEEGDKTHG